MCLGSECPLPPHMVFETLMALIKCPQLVSDEKAKLIRAYDMSDRLVHTFLASHPFRHK